MGSRLNREMKRSGFSLIEILIVIAIIGLLLSIVLSSANSAKSKARDAKRIAELRLTALALQFYFDEYQKVPNTTDRLNNTDSDTSAGIYSIQGVCNNGIDWSSQSDLQTLKTTKLMTTLPKDPLNISPFCYLYEPHDDWGTGGGTNGVGACLWTTLEQKTGDDNHNKTIGIVIGNPLNINNLEYLNPNSLFNKYPIGYECGPLDEVLNLTGGSGTGGN